MLERSQMIYANVPLQYLVNTLYVNYIQLELCTKFLEQIRHHSGNCIMEAKTDGDALDFGTFANTLTSIIDNHNQILEVIIKITLANGKNFEISEDIFKQQNLTKEMKILQSLQKTPKKLFYKCIEVSNRTKEAIGNKLDKEYGFTILSKRINIF